MRAVVLDADGQPRLADVAAPAEPMRVLACGLCGSDVEKIGRAPAGTVLGHEVVARRADGTRMALLHHRPCGVCERCRAGHESTCAAFAEPTIVPGGFAEQVAAAEGVELPDGIDDATGTYVEPLACVLRGAERVPRGRVLVVGHGFIGRLFSDVLGQRGDRKPAESELLARFVEAAGAATRARQRSVGLGEDVRLHGEGVIGSGLELEGELLQLCAFTSDDRTGVAFARPSHRR